VEVFDWKLFVKMIQHQNGKKSSRVSAFGNYNFDFVAVVFEPLIKLKLVTYGSYSNTLPSWPNNRTHGYIA
jgi:hypothetical protein